MTTTEHTCCAVYWEKKDGHYDHIMEEFATEAEFCESTDATDHWCMFVNWKEYSVCQTGGIIVTVICVAIAVRTGQQFLLLLLHDSPLFSSASAVIADSCGWRAPWQGITVLLRDLMKTWDCFGFTTLPGFDKPVDRQLTTMSAAYAGATMMTAAPEAQFANIPVQMPPAVPYAQPPAQPPFATMGSA